MLILLQPGIEPLGQFDIEDDDQSLVVGGEIGILQALDYDTDGYASDVFHQGPAVHVTLDSATAAQLHGLVDEGTTQGLDGKGYGTMFGQVLGTNAGQGTGVGTQSTSGAVVVGPHTMTGSGKATLWTKPGLYGITRDAWATGSEFDALALNDALYGTASGGATAGKMTTSVAGAQTGCAIGLSADTSLVSTTSTYAGETAADIQHAVFYFFGVQS